MLNSCSYLLVLLAVAVSVARGQTRNSPALSPLTNISAIKCLQLDDLDGDGIDDYAVSDLAEISTTGQIGSVRIVSSQSQTVLATHWGTAKAEDWGATLAAGDFNGNGIQELVVGVPNALERRWQPSGRRGALESKRRDR